MSDKKLWDQYVALEKERDALRVKLEVAKFELRLIAETDPIDDALDPQRAIRIAWHTLKRIEE